LIRGPINSGLVRRVLYLHLHRLRVFDFRLGLFGRQWILDSYYDAQLWAMYLYYVTRFFLTVVTP